MGREGRVMELNYKNVNGYLLPELEYKSGEQMLHIGKYGFLRRDYLKTGKISGDAFKRYAWGAFVGD